MCFFLDPSLLMNIEHTRDKLIYETDKEWIMDDPSLVGQEAGGQEWHTVYSHNSVKLMHGLLFIQGTYKTISRVFIIQNSLGGNALPHASSPAFIILLFLFNAKVCLKVIVRWSFLIILWNNQCQCWGFKIWELFFKNKK